MAHRSFTDTAGIPWDVWDVVPRWVERRIAIRRTVGAAQSATAERRRLPDRRQRNDPNELRVRVTPGFEQGWLAFASPAEKRRFAPIPEGWERAPETLLEALCRRARQVGRIAGRLIE